MSIEEKLRDKIWLAIKKIEEEKIFVHSEPLKVRIREGEEVSLPLVTTLTTVNALVSRGAMLLYGGYGGGKTTLVKLLGRLLTGLSLKDIEASIIRAHPQLTEEKMVGRLDVGRLLKEGAEDIVWRNFIKSFWKIIDEVNRLSPGAQDAIFSILSEGIAKYFDGIYETKDYVLYATINPRDVGTFPLGLPFLDRFGLAVPISSPAFDELSDLTETIDERLHEYDDARIPGILTIDELIVAWNLASRIPLSMEAKLFISALARELSLCARTLKETGAFLQLTETICRGCHFNTENAICNKVYTPLSVRAVKDITRYSKALAWLLGLNYVPLGVVLAIAPFVIWHRISISPKFLEKFYGNAFKAVKNLVNEAFKNFIRRLPLYHAFINLEMGAGDMGVVNTLREASASDLIVSMDLYPTAELLTRKEYQALIRDLTDAIEKEDLDSIMTILTRIDKEVPANLKGRILRVYEKLLQKKKRVFVTNFEEWRKLVKSLQDILPNSREALKRTLEKPRLEKIQLKIGSVIIHSTGMLSEAPVFVEIYGIGEPMEIADKISKFMSEVSSIERGDFKENSSESF